MRKNERVNHNVTTTRYQNIKRFGGSEIEAVITRVKNIDSIFSTLFWFYLLAWVARINKSKRNVRSPANSYLWIQEVCAHFISDCLKILGTKRHVWNNIVDIDRLILLIIWKFGILFVSFARNRRTSMLHRDSGIQIIGFL